MDRRSFLGSMIGLACSAPFFARLWHEPVQIVSTTKYRMLFRDSNLGFTVQAPGIKDIGCKPGEFTFIAERLNVMKTLRVDQVVLLTEKDKL